MQRTTLVSVYITTCNRLEKLKEALASVQRQTYKNIEIIVADDCSDDGTQEFMDDYVNNNINTKYIRSKIRQGACANRNNAINVANGEFITGLDDDDLFRENRIELFLERWEEEFSFLCANYYDVYNNEHYRLPSACNDKVFNYRDLYFKNVATNQIFTKTSYLKVIKGFNPEIKRLQDWDTWLRLSFNKGKFLFLGSPTYYMRHENKLEEPRVSTSYPIDRALEDLLNYNRKIYGWRYYQRMCYVKYLRGELSFASAIYWALVEFKPSNFFRYFLKNKNI
ncbi:hypothetical protein ABW08_22985 [Pluralibacter gergoviae]|uniref:glycosyltransferase family 2 protein n=1 Tax=Pluralibacter gergoviae TaxID=61647 RepID=UPI0006510586|nr:glycosyltransferase [Pluralibacter gergoviae]KMK01531.1 hypothetical protein ABW08_22985 [Pluralibacter gergoviae]